MSTENTYSSSLSKLSTTIPSVNTTKLQALKHEPISDSSDTKLLEMIRKAVDQSTSAMEERVVQAVLNSLPNTTNQTSQFSNDEFDVFSALKKQSGGSKKVTFSNPHSTKINKIQQQQKFNLSQHEEDISEQDDDDEVQFMHKQNNCNDDYDERIASQIIQQIGPYGSFKNWVRLADWKHARNKHEAESLANAIDCFLSEGVDSNSLGLEILIRRLNGVHLADTTNNWSVCSAVQWTGPNNTLLPRSMLTKAYRQAAQFEKLSSKVSKNFSNSTNRFHQNQQNKFQKFGKFSAQNKNSKQQFSSSSGTTGGNTSGASS